MKKRFAQFTLPQQTTLIVLSKLPALLSTHLNGEIFPALPVAL